jgi:hypothetical protein
MARKKKRNPGYDPDWARAKQLCRLNMEDIRMAKELGLNPRKLVKNRPNPHELWKAPIKDWIHELYRKRQEKMAKKAQAKKAKEQQSTRQHDGVPTGDMYLELRAQSNASEGGPEDDLLDDHAEIPF